MEHPIDTKAQLRVACGIACKLLSVLLMNQALFPLFDAVFTYARDISITVSSSALIAVAMVAIWRPRLIDARKAGLVLALGAVASAAGIAGGLSTGWPWLLVLGACLATTCRSLLTLTADLAAVSLPPGRMVVCVTGGVLAAHVADLALAGLDPLVCSLLCVAVLPLATLALCGPAAAQLVSGTAEAEPAAELSITRPATFLPLTSTLYVFQFIVYAAFGFALRFGEVNGAPSFSTALSVAALATLLAVAVARRKKPAALDALCGVVALALLSGLMLAAVRAPGAEVLANTVLMVGNSLYSVFIVCLLVTLSQRNPVNALSVFGWVNGIGALGTTLGALLGTTGNALVASGDPAAASYLAVGFATLFAAYVLFFLRGYTFEAQIAAVEPAPSEVLPPSPSGEEAFQARCHAIAQRYGLTPREEETFAMLARGRNREHIENTLQVSRNTVKAHVKHVYAKLGIHSHQELLDLVEQGVAEKL